MFEVVGERGDCRLEASWLSIDIAIAIYVVVWRRSGGISSSF